MWWLCQSTRVGKVHKFLTGYVFLERLPSRVALKDVEMIRILIVASDGILQRPRLRFRQTDQDSKMPFQVFGTPFFGVELDSLLT